MSQASVRGTYTIGEVLGQLRPEFPDVKHSKIRFLEAEGLVVPQRTAAGYRKFSAADVARLRYVLAVQRDHYLPLKVIKQHLEAIDRGLEPPDHAAAGPRVPRPLVAASGLPGPDSFGRQAPDVRLTREELCQAAGLEPELLDRLEEYGLVVALPGGTHFDADALLIATAAAELARFGIEPRHLRAYKAAADREVGLVEQVVAPLLRQRDPEAQARAEEVEREIAASSVRLHAALVRVALRRS